MKKEREEGKGGREGGREGDGGRRKGGDGGDRGNRREGKEKREMKGGKSIILTPASVLQL